MTRDEVLAEALKAIGPEVNWCGCTGAIQALKSKPPEKSPPEKSPELTLESNPYDTNAMSHTELADLVFDLHRRWTGAQAQYASLLVQRDREHSEALARIEGLEAERDHYRQALAGAEVECDRLRTDVATERTQANEWLTQLHDAQKELSRMRWEASGAPMKGETP